MISSPSAPPKKNNGLIVEQSPIDSYLAQQQQLQTPVARFSDKHASLTAEGAQSYSDLIPLSKPSAHQQYAFEVNLDQCTGCKACVAGCHSMNGLNENEMWRDVGTIIDTQSAQPYQQTITSACHHCIDPACLNGCPVLAYDKDPVTGIVRHLDDQCIGCQYCVLTCPYDVPKFSDSLGIVRKCDMCHQRLEVGEAPACVQACPTEAIKITLVDVPVIIEQSKDVSSFLPGAPSPQITQPTTQYISSKPIPQTAQAADANSLRPEHAHFPLVFMLTLSQGGIGALIIAAVAFLMQHSDLSGATLRIIGTAYFFAALGISVLHLGRPQGAWRAFLGWRKSWLSREILVFGPFAGLAFGYMTLYFIPSSNYIFVPFNNYIEQCLAGLVIAIGLTAILASSMVYVATKRFSWRAPITFNSFYGSALVIGLAATLPVTSSIYFTLGFLLAVAVRLSIESLRLRAVFKPNHLDHLLARRCLTSLKGYTVSRFSTALLASFCAITATTQPALSTLFGALALLFITLSELMERTLFFQSVVAPKMPGGFRR